MTAVTALSITPRARAYKRKLSKPPSLLSLLSQERGRGDRGVVGDRGPRRRLPPPPRIGESTLILPLIEELKAHPDSWPPSGWPAVPGGERLTTQEVRLLWLAFECGLAQHEISDVLRALGMHGNQQRVSHLMRRTLARLRASGSPSRRDPRGMSSPASISSQRRRSRRTPSAAAVGDGAGEYSTTRPSVS